MTVWICGSIIAALILLSAGLLWKLLRQRERLRSQGKAEAENQAKSIFLANTSHEIRTPMNAIIGMSELILREDVNPAVYEQASNIRQAAMNLLSIVNDILDFSKMESGKLEITPVTYQLSSLLNDTIAITRTKIMEKPVLFITNIDSRLPNTLVGDANRLRQILLNILSNAVKYTRKGSITLSITGTAEREEVLLKIVIADSGIGIREEDQARLFENYSRLDRTRNAGIEGTGLGLPIAQNLCHLMGGSISIESKYGMGSAFTITIPQRIDPAAGPDVPVIQTRFAGVEDREKHHVLFYTTRLACGESWAWSAENLGVPCALVTRRQEFAEALESGTWSHVIVSHFLQENALEAIRSSEKNSSAILIRVSEYGAARQDYNALHTPVHTLTLANLLNGKIPAGSAKRRQRVEFHFTAPEASVLLVDDVITNLKVVEGLLAPYRMRIDTAGSGMEALEMLQKQRYDLVLLDYQMPVMDGMETVRIVRGMRNGDAYYGSLPVIALTANAVPGTRELLVEGGFSDYLAKPVSLADLDKALDRWLPEEKKMKPIHSLEKAEEPHPVIPGVDTARGLAQCGGDWKIYGEALEAFCGDGETKTGEIRESLEEGNLDQYTVLLHGIRDAGNSIGAEELSRQAWVLEEAGKKGRDEHIRAGTPALLLELEKLIHGIRLEAGRVGSPVSFCRKEADQDEENLPA